MRSGQKREYINLTYDSKRINEDVPIRQVLALYTDINTDTRGNVSCPSTSHIDKKPSAHIYDHPNGNNCKCFSCGVNYSPIDVVMEHKNVSFPEACKMLIADFGLSMSHYSNIDEVERVNGALRSGKFIERFPLDKSDCEVLNYAYIPENSQFPSMSDLWQDSEESRKSIEDMLFARCAEYKEMYTSYIQNETERFNALYSLREKGEWNEAKLIKKALDKVSALTDIKLTARQRELHNDIRELYEMCENIDYYETKYKQVDEVEQKLRSHQNERKEQGKQKRWER